MNPPDKAVVLCVDEKSQIQALNRTQPGLPMKKGRCGRMTHDYQRHGTTTLFAALHVLAGTLIGECQARHRHQEFLQFLRRLDREFPLDLDLHLIVDNYGTHKHPKMKSWLAGSPSALPSPFHSDQHVVVESGGALVWSAHGEADSARQLFQRGRIGAGDQRVSRRKQPPTQAIPMDGEC